MSPLLDSNVLPDLTDIPDLDFVNLNKFKNDEEYLWYIRYVDCLLKYLKSIK